MTSLCLHINGKEYNHKQCSNSVFSKAFQQFNHIEYVEKMREGLYIKYKKPDDINNNNKENEPPIINFVVPDDFVDPESKQQIKEQWEEWRNQPRTQEVCKAIVKRNTSEFYNERSSYEYYCNKDNCNNARNALSIKCKAHQNIPLTTREMMKPAIMKL